MKKQTLFILMLLVAFPLASFCQSKLFLGELLNGMSLTTFLVYLTLAFVGMCLNLASDIIRRNPDSTTSPQRFVLSYWWNDNKSKLVVSIITIPIAIIFFNDLVGIEITKLGALFIGLSSDHIAELLKRKNIIANSGI